jgi:1-acyl-sn-glycerol-3-phosphate acyltransferase
MSITQEVQAYVAAQDRLAWRRWIMRHIVMDIGLAILARIKVEGRENIPSSGPTILMMNHISTPDPVLCMAAVRNRYVIPMTKVELAKSRMGRFLVWWWGAFTVDRSEADRKALQTALELLNAGHLILIAPEGTRSPEGLIEPKAGMAYIAAKTNAVVVPAAVSEAVDWQERLKRFRQARARITFGEPFRFKTEGRKRIPREELDLMLEEAMYQLAATIPEESASLRGAYSDLSRATTQTLEFVSEKPALAIP